MGDTVDEVIGVISAEPVDAYPPESPPIKVRPPITADQMRDEIKKCMSENGEEITEATMRNICMWLKQKATTRAFVDRVVEANSVYEIVDDMLKERSADKRASAVSLEISKL